MLGQTHAHGDWWLPAAVHYAVEILGPDFRQHSVGAGAN